MNAEYDSLCLDDVYSNAPTTVYVLGAVKTVLTPGSSTSWYQYVLICTGVYEYMSVHTAAMYLYILVYTKYIQVCTILPNLVQGHRIPDGVAGLPQPMHGAHWHAACRARRLALTVASLCNSGCMVNEHRRQSGPFSSTNLSSPPLRLPPSAGDSIGGHSS